MLKSQKRYEIQNSFNGILIGTCRRPTQLQCHFEWLEWLSEICNDSTICNDSWASCVLKCDRNDMAPTWAAGDAVVADASSPSRCALDRPTTPQSNCNKSNSASPVSRDIHSQKRSSVLLRGNAHTHIHGTFYCRSMRGICSHAVCVCVCLSVCPSVRHVRRLCQNE